MRYCEGVFFCPRGVDGEEHFYTAVVCVHPTLFFHYCSFQNHRERGGVKNDESESYHRRTTIVLTTGTRGLKVTKHIHFQRPG